MARKSDPAAAHILATIEELAARWHRAQRNLDRVKDQKFSFGRMEGYCQAIALLLNNGCKPKQVQEALEKGQL